MHLTSYPKNLHSELHLNPTVSHSGGLLKTCNHSNMSGGRLPLSVILSNTLRCGGSHVGQKQLRPPALQPYCENDTLGLYQTVSEDGDTQLDVWTVIRPGHVREKIAIFASEVGQAMGSHTTTVSLSRAGKAKGSWEETSNAKRRRRFGSRQKAQEEVQQNTNMPPVLLRCNGTQEEEDKEEVKVSVGEMVAFLEQRVSERQPNTKPLFAVQRSSTTIMLSKALPPEDSGEEPDSVRVADMVAKLECLRRQTEVELSRSNSLRRTVGRILLAGAEPSPARSPLPLSQTTDQTPDQEATSCSETLQPSALITSHGILTHRALENQGMSSDALPPSHKEEEPVPGLLFLPPQTHLGSASSHQTLTDTIPRTQHSQMTHEQEPPTLATSSSQTEKRSDSEEEAGRAQLVSPVSRRSSASQEFLEVRQRLQQLLEPLPFLAALPHHLLLQILLLLPTRSLAALKCTCRYFKLVIETYAVRPADSLWVSDPRYRDDPCKQCKKRYGRGDVSLCRWHHKPYCQALPYGPGYWMCCRSTRRDAPGCNVGLHDNRWVLAFHGINVPIYRRSGEEP